MKKGTSNEAWAILSIILLLFVITFSIGFLFKIPGFAGKFLGFIGQGLVNLTAGFWSWLRSVIGSVISRGVEYFTIGLSVAITPLFLSRLSQQLASKYLSEYLIPPWFFSTGKPTWAWYKWVLKEGLKDLGRSAINAIRHPSIIVRGVVNALKYAAKHPGVVVKGIVSTLKGALIGAVIALVVDSALRATGIVDKIDNLVGTPQIAGVKLHVGAAVSGAISGAIAGAAVGAMFGGVGAIPGAIVGAIVGGIMSLFTG